MTLAISDTDEILVLDPSWLLRTLATLIKKESLHNGILLPFSMYPQTCLFDLTQI